MADGRLPPYPGRPTTGPSGATRNRARGRGHPRFGDQPSGGDYIDDFDDDLSDDSSYTFGAGFDGGSDGGFRGVRRSAPMNDPMRRDRDPQRSPGPYFGNPFGGPLDEGSHGYDRHDRRSSDPPGRRLPERNPFADRHNDPREEDTFRSPSPSFPRGRDSFTGVAWANDSYDDLQSSYPHGSRGYNDTMPHMGDNRWNPTPGTNLQQDQVYPSMRAMTEMSAIFGVPTSLLMRWANLGGIYALRHDPSILIDHSFYHHLCDIGVIRFGDYREYQDTPHSRSRFS